MSHGARSGENGWFGKTVTFSNFNERKSKETNIPQSPTFIENAVNNEWQFQSLVTGNRTENQHKIILAKVQK